MFFWAVLSGMLSLSVGLEIQLLVFIFKPYPTGWDFLLRQFFSWVEASFVKFYKKVWFRVTYFGKVLPLVVSMWLSEMLTWRFPFLESQFSFFLPLLPEWISSQQPCCPTRAALWFNSYWKNPSGLCPRFEQPPSQPLAICWNGRSSSLAALIFTPTPPASQWARMVHLRIPLSLDLSETFSLPDTNASRLPDCVPIHWCLRVLEDTVSPSFVINSFSRCWFYYSVFNLGNRENSKWQKQRLFPSSPVEYL